MEVINIRRRLSREERKLEIQDAARKKFLEKGYRNTTMEDIIEETTLSKGGFYNYYKSTSDILYDIMSNGNNYRRNMIKKYLQKNKSYSKDQKISEILTEKMTDDNSFMPLYVMFLQEINHDENLRKLYENLKYEVIKDLFSFDDEIFLENKKIFMNDFIISFMNSIMLGSEILEEREVFIQNRDVLIEMVKTCIECLKKGR